MDTDALQIAFVISGWIDSSLDCDSRSGVIIFFRYSLSFSLFEILPADSDGIGIAGGDFIHNSLDSTGNFSFV
jgi:hypothetical protein